MKKARSFFSFFMLLGLFTIRAYGYDGYINMCDGHVYYRISDGYAAITYPNDTYHNWQGYYSYRPTGILSIPTSITHNGVSYIVTSIDNHAFSGCSGLVSVNIPSTVTFIGDSAFQSCTGMSSVNIPNTVSTIGIFTFANCTNLISINIPNSVTTIGEKAFNNCTSLTSVTIPNSVTYLSGFCGCTGLISIDLPSSVTTIGNTAFYGCTGLTSVNLPSSVTTIGNSAFYGCTGLTSVNLPSSVTTIGNSAFYGCTGLTSVIIPESVTTIGSSVFRDCYGITNVYFNAVNCSTAPLMFMGDTNLTNFTFGNNVTVIPEGLFNSGSPSPYYDCTIRLTSITIPSSVISIGGYAFYGCEELTSITIPSNVTSIGGYAFANCSMLKTIYYNATQCNSMGDYYGNTYRPVFLSCPALDRLVIGDNVTYLPDSAFYNCNWLDSVIIGNGVTSFGKDIFKGCTDIDYIYYNVGSDSISFPFNENQNYLFPSSSYITLVIGDDVTHIPANAFCGMLSRLKVVLISNSVTQIGTNAFYHCTGLTSLTIGSGVDSICSGAFGCDDFLYVCSGLTEIYSYANVAPKLGNNVFPVLSNNYSVIIPCGSISSYTSRWTSLTNFVESTGFALRVQSDNTAMGTAQVITPPSCTDLSATVSATAFGGYVFDHWSNGATNNPYTLTVTSDSMLIAFFSPAATVTVVSNNTVMGTVSGGGDYAIGSTATLTATANNGYHFTQWQDGSSLNPRNVNVSTDVTYTAFFAPNEYTVSVISDNITMGTVTGSGTYNYGTNVTISATPNSGYRFIQWHDGNTNASRSVLVIDNAIYTAYFGIEEYTVTVVSNNASMGSVSGGGTYENGSTATLTASANNGYHFTQWQDGNVQNPRTVTVAASVTYTAFFAPNEYTINAVSNNTTMGSVAGGGTYDYGTTINIIATANGGYHFDHWSDGSTSNPYSLNVTEDLDLIGYFVADDAEGIGNVITDCIQIHSNYGCICIEGVDGMTVCVYNIMGQEVVRINGKNVTQPLAAGVYFVKIGILPAKKVVVMK